jgi:hypothetical protein
VPDYELAALAGLHAAQVMELPAYLQKAAGLPVHQDIFAETGAIVRAPRGVRRVAGWAGHACTAVIVAIAYAAFFDAVGGQPSSVLTGMVAGNHPLRRWWRRHRYLPPPAPGRGRSPTSC